MKAIDTVYNGYKFRSRLEARWAVFFDEAGITWEYEKEGYDLGDGVYYLPDFWLPQLDMFAEIKGTIPNKKEMEKAGVLSEQSRKIVGVLGNIPTANSMFENWEEKYFGYAFLKNKDWVDMPYYFSKCIRCGMYGFHFEGKVRQCNCFENDADGHDDYAIQFAYTKARQARFEHGECGK